MVRSRHLLVAATLFALAVAAYGGALEAPFHFDDRAQIAENSSLRSLANFLPGAPGYANPLQRRLGYLSFALNRAALGERPAGYRVVNVAIHLANALLLYWLVLLALRAPRLRGSAAEVAAQPIAFAAAALFLSHPLQTMAVTYLVQRFASLAAFFYLASVVLYLLFREAPLEARWRRRACYGGALLAACCAMNTKEIAATLPVALLASEWALYGRPSRRTLVALAPLGLTALIIPALLLLPLIAGSGLSASALAGQAAAATRLQTALSRGDYFLTEWTVIARYLRLLLLPYGQSIEHDLPLQRSLLAPAVLGAGLLLSLLLGGACWLLAATPEAPRRGRLDPGLRLVALGILWFFIALAVESSVIPIADVMFEHRVYLPSAGFFAAAAAALGILAVRLAGRRAPRLITGAALLVALGLCGLSAARNRVWESEVSLWSDAAAKSPLKARAHYNLGAALVAAGRPQQAAAAFAEDVRLDPFHAEGYENLGLALADAGRRAEALAPLRRAVEMRPEHAPGLVSLGRLLVLGADRAGHEEAVALLLRAVALEPALAPAWGTLGGALNQTRRFDETVRLLEAAPAAAANAEAQFNLGVAYAALGDRAAAGRKLALVGRLAPPLARQLSDYLGAAGQVP